jgi:hypothetical protein
VANALQQVVTLALFKEFIEKVQAAISRVAVQVAATQADQTERTRLRRSLSVKVLEDTDSYARRFAWAVAAIPTVTVQSNDADILAQVSVVWDAMAGAEPPTAP